MSNYSIYFGLCLGKNLYGLTDNLSKTLQKTKPLNTSKLWQKQEVMKILITSMSCFGRNRQQLVALTNQNFQRNEKKQIIPCGSILVIAEKLQIVPVITLYHQLANASIFQSLLASFFQVAHFFVFVLQMCHDETRLNKKPSSLRYFLKLI